MKRCAILFGLVLAVSASVASAKSFSVFSSTTTGTCSC